MYVYFLVYFEDHLHNYVSNNFVMDGIGRSCSLYVEVRQCRKSWNDVMGDDYVKLGDLLSVITKQIYIC